MEEERALSSATDLVGVFDDALRVLIADLLETMAAESQCIGLAAPQIGSSLRVAVARPEEVLVLVNPRVVSTCGESNVTRESCMSLRGFSGRVERRESVTVAFQDADGAAQTRHFEGYSARIVQHEIDHLDGILIRDRALGGLRATERPVRTTGFRHV